MVAAVAIAVNHVAGNSDVAIAGAGLTALVAYVPVAVPASAMQQVWLRLSSRLQRRSQAAPPIVADERV